MAKRFSKKLKEQLFHDTVLVTQDILGLRDRQIEVFFQKDLDQRAYCEYDPQYKTARIGADIGRIRIFEVVEFGTHEVCHIPTWPVAALLEKYAGEDEEKLREATDAYELLTTEIAHAILPMVMAKLEELGKLPPEAKDYPKVIVVRDRKRIRKVT